MDQTHSGAAACSESSAGHTVAADELAHDAIEGVLELVVAGEDGQVGQKLRGEDEGGVAIAPLPGAQDARQAAANGGASS